MDQSVVDMDRNIHNQVYKEESFPFSRRALIEQVRSDFDMLIHFIRHPSSVSPLVFLLLLLILPITLLAAQSYVNYSPRAQTVNSVKVSFAPSTVNLPPASQIKIMLDSQANKVPFARVVFTFDKSKVKLVSEITSSARFSTVVEKTTVQQTNSQGRGVIVVAASPSDIIPSGSFELASFTLDAVSADIGPVSVNLEPNDLQIVEAGGLALNPQVQPLMINSASPGNPSATVTRPIGHSSAPCQNTGSISCFNQWFREFAGSENTRYSDLSGDGQVTLLDFEFWRRAAYP